MIKIKNFWAIRTRTAGNDQLLKHQGFFNAVWTKYKNSILILNIVSTMIDINLIKVIEPLMCIYLLLNHFMLMTQYLLHGELFPVANLLDRKSTRLNSSHVNISYA